MFKQIMAGISLFHPFSWLNYVPVVWLPLRQEDPEPLEPPVVNVVHVASAVSSRGSDSARDEDGMAYVSFWVWCQRFEHMGELMNLITHLNLIYCNEFHHQMMWSKRLCEIWIEWNWRVKWSGQVVRKECRNRHDSSIHFVRRWLLQFFQCVFFRKVPHQGPMFHHVSKFLEMQYDIEVCTLYGIFGMVLQHLTRQYTGTALFNHIST